MWYIRVDDYRTGKRKRLGWLWLDDDRLGKWRIVAQRAQATTCDINPEDAGDIRAGCIVSELSDGDPDSDVRLTRVW